jgi:lysophospholipase L1-like esterase
MIFVRRICAASLLLLSLAFAGQDAIGQDAKEVSTPVGKLELADGDSIVFLGDSITHQCLYTQYVEDYFYTRFPKMRLKFHNSGVGGARAWDALQRFDEDVAAYKPKYVTVLLGMNDGTYQPFNQEVFSKYHADMTTVVDRIKKIGATPILMTPTMYDARAAVLYPRKGRVNPPERLEFYNSVLAYYGTWLRHVAVENGYGFVDMWGPLNNLTLEARKKNPKFTIIRDAVHPDAPGQVVMAVAIIADLGLPRPLSSIRVTIQPNEKTLTRASGGEISGTKVTGDGVEFTWLASSLPWVVPEEAALGAKLTKLGHKHSREALEVHGLKPGRYELSIDGDVVGTWPAEALSRHIELQENAKTPQHQQALHIAELNLERNSGPVKDLRNEWRVFQQWARGKHGVSPMKPEQVAALEKRLEGLAERVKQHKAAALKIEDQIFKANQPKPRKYVLKKVASAPTAASKK